MVNKKIKKRKQLRRRRIRRAILNVLSICAVMVLVVCVADLVADIIAYMRSEQTAADLRKLYMSSGYAETFEAVGLPTERPLIPVETDEPAFTVEPTEFPEVTAEPDSTQEPVHRYQDQFIDLHNLNDDLIGWIYANEFIDYPIVWRAEDNDYYMNHDYYGSESQAGWIFLDKRNAGDVSDDQLLIYGHNMRNGEMFGELDRYRNLEYVIKNPIIEIQFAWEPEPRQYVLISLFDASMNKSHSSYIKITNFNFENSEDKLEYIREISRRSIHDLPCDAAEDDQLVTLVTCSYSQPNGRFLVFARELREDETEEQIAELFAQLK